MNTRYLASILYIVSLLFFILGLNYPIMGSKLFLRIDRDDIYLFSSVRTFMEDGEWFLGLIILIFTLVLPLLKYLFLGLKLLSVALPRQKSMGLILEIINKWAMLDVFIVALIILNMKFDSLILVTKIKAGTTFFAISVLLLMLTSFFIKIQESNQKNKPNYDLPTY